jgi:hypothetical protein
MRGMCAIQLELEHWHHSQPISRLVGLHIRCYLSLGLAVTDLNLNKFSQFMGLVQNRIEVSGCKLTTLFCILNMLTMKKLLGYPCVTSHYGIMDILLEILGII